MVLCLAGLLAGHMTDDIRIIGVAVGILVVGLLFPTWLLPLATLWFAIGRGLSVVFSIIILTLLFYLLITPVGLFRRMLGYDMLRVKQWKKSTTSVFIKRDHTFRSSDIEKPY